MGVSCGEPLSAAAHELGMSALTSHYINAYWATEHGAIVLAHAYGNADQPLKADARMRPLPWVGAAVWVPEQNDAAGAYNIHTHIYIYREREIEIEIEIDVFIYLWIYIHIYVCVCVHLYLSMYRYICIDI